MPSRQEITKVELVTEAIEGLVLASVRLSGFSGSPTGSPFEIAYKNVADARTNLAEALHSLLQPVLRVVTPPEKRTEVVPYEGKGIEGMNLA
jgi:hypothetical protein